MRSFFFWNNGIVLDRSVGFSLGLVWVQFGFSLVRLMNIFCLGVEIWQSVYVKNK